MVLLEYSTTICKTCAALLAGKFEEVSTGLMIEPAWRKVLPSGGGKRIALAFRQSHGERKSGGVGGSTRTACTAACDLLGNRR